MEYTKERVEKVLKNIGEVKVPSTYLFLGVNETISEKVVDEISNLLQIKHEDISTIRPADSEGKKEILSIKQARELIHTFSMTPSGKVRVGAIYDADNISIVAANAFLKLLEEPPKYGLLLLFSKTDNIIETIKSRSTIINCYSNIGDSETGLVQFLVNKDFHEQSSALENVVKENQINLFLDQLQSIYQKKLRSGMSKKMVNALKDVESARKKIVKNANPRLTLECLVLKHSRILENVEL